MIRQKKRWEDEELIMIGREEARADFIHGTTVSSTLSLNGDWKFMFLEAPEYSPDTFFEPIFDDSTWDTIKVPSCWQRQGYGHNHYTDVWYLFPINPPFVPSKNPTGIYRRNFNIDTIEPNKKVILRFDGVSSAYDIWVNGKHIGYSKVSRLGSSFDITEYVCCGRNQITLRVYQWSDGSYLECQDMWWLSGIFRDVYLLFIPQNGVKDLHIISDFDPSTNTGSLDLSIAMYKEQAINVSVELLDLNNDTILRETALSDKEVFSFFKNELKVSPWSAEYPNLYKLNIVISSNGKIIDEITNYVGFRRVCIENAKICINGKAVLFNGVNMHDFSPEGGLTVDKAIIEEDIKLMKRHNINAVRCAHYPKASYFYDLCDKYGLYVIDEADFENHGFEWIEHYKWINEEKSWENAYVDRVERMVKEHRNHPSIIMWSLGNEASTGPNIDAQAKAVRKLDNSRLIHYEGDMNADISDVYSTMYTRLDGMLKIAHGNDAHNKPHILCEYGHSMGVGPGNLEEYQELFEKYDRLQGGFIWEWYDQGPAEKDENGNTVYFYGGDYGDTPNNSNFCLDGLLSPDRRISTGLKNYKQVIRPFKASISDISTGEISIKNKNIFSDTSDISLIYKIHQGEHCIFAGSIPTLDIKAGCESKLIISDIVSAYKHFDNTADCYIDISLVYNKDMPFCEKGYEVSFDQLLIKAALKNDTQIYEEKSGNSGCEIFETNTCFEVKGKDYSVKFDKVTGDLLVLESKGQNIFNKGPSLNMMRAAIDNDMYKVGDWYNKYFIQKQQEQSEYFESKECEGFVKVNIGKHFSPLSMAFGFKAEYNYYIFPDRKVVMNLNLKGFKKTSFAPEFIPRIGIELRLPSAFTNVKWCGLGPDENYPDMKSHVKYGVYSKNIEDMSTVYIKPQENGHREGTDIIELNSKEDTLVINSLKPIGFNVHNYTIEALEKAKHWNELETIDEVILHIDAKHSGLGTNSCGEEQTYKNKVRLNDYHLNLTFEF